MRAVCALPVGNVPDCHTCCPTGTRACCRTSKRRSGHVQLYPLGIFPTSGVILTHAPYHTEHAKQFKFEKKHILCAATGEKPKWGPEATTRKGAVYETVTFDAITWTQEARLL